jgi:hypothetical protein
MRLSELVSRMSPTTFTEIALVMFLAVFALMASRAYSRKARAEHGAYAALPLCDDAVAAAAPDRGARTARSSSDGRAS